jgi:transposase-like protein
MLSERRDEDAATAFFKQAINNNGFKVCPFKADHDFILCTLGN